MKGKEDLIKVLTIFQEMRELLVSRTLDENPELFGKFFEFEGRPVIFRLAFEEEILGWLNSHYNEFDKESWDFPDDVLRIISGFYRGWIDSNEASDESEIPVVYASIFEEKRRIIDQLLSGNEKDVSNYNKLIYSMKKDKAIFERMFASMRKGIGG